MSLIDSVIKKRAGTETRNINNQNTKINLTNDQRAYLIQKITNNDLTAYDVTATINSTVIGEVNIGTGNTERLPKMTGRAQLGVFQKAGDVAASTAGRDPLYVELQGFETGLPLQMAIELEGQTPQWIDVPFPVKADTSDKFRFLIGEPQLAQLRQFGLSETNCTLAFRQTPDDNRTPTITRIPVNEDGARMVFPMPDDLAALPGFGQTGLPELIAGGYAGAVSLDVPGTNRNITSRGRFQPLDLRSFTERMSPEVSNFVKVDPRTGAFILYTDFNLNFRFNSLDSAQLASLEEFAKIAGSIEIQDVATGWTPDGEVYIVMITLGKSEKNAPKVNYDESNNAITLTGEAAVANTDESDIESKKIRVIIKDNCDNILRMATFQPAREGNFPLQGLQGRLENSPGRVHVDGYKPPKT